MDTIITILIVLLVLIIVGVCSFLIGLWTRIFSEKRELKSAKSELQRRLDIISAQHAELVTTQTALHEVDEKYTVWKNTLDALLKASVHGILTTDSHMRVRHFNKHFCEMWDLAEDEIHIGAKVYEILKRCMEKTLEPEMFYLNHHKVNHSRDVIWRAENQLSDGKIFQSSSSPVRGGDGTYYGRIWEFFDVTEYIRKEKDLSEAYNNLESKNIQFKVTQAKLIHQNSILTVLQEHLAGGFCIFDENGNLSNFNQKFLDIWDIEGKELKLDLSLEAVLQTQAFALHSDADVQTALIEEILHDRTSSFHHEIVLVNGTILERHSIPLIDEGGVYHGRLWEFINITSHIQREQALYDAYSTIEAQYQELTGTHEALQQQYSILEEAKSDLEEKNTLFSALLEMSTHGVITINSQWRVRYFNKHFCKMWDIPEDAVCIGADGNEILSHCVKQTNDPEEFLAHVNAIIDSKASIWNDEIYLSDGKIFQTISAPIRRANEEYYGRVWIFFDITERKRYERHMHLANQKMGLLSKITRHDIMDQLSNVFAISDLISEDVSDVHTKELLERMEQALNTVRNQIEFTRNYQELGNRGAEWQDMNECIKHATSLLIHLPDLPPVEVLADDLPMIFADPLFEKVMYKLIEKPLQHGECVTHIKVTFSVEDDGHGILIFRDNGTGIPDELKSRIFDKDFKKIPDFFLIREICSLTGMTIRECGIHGEGAQFEIMIPTDYWKWE